MATDLLSSLKTKLCVRRSMSPTGKCCHTSRCATLATSEANSFSNTCFAARTTRNSRGSEAWPNKCLASWAAWRYSHASLLT